MERAELIQLLEEVIGQELNEEKIAGVLDPMIEKHLLGDNMKRQMVMTWDELKAHQDQEEKRPTFSQFLGDLSTIAKGGRPRHVAEEAANKWYKPIALQGTPDNVMGMLSPDQVKALYTSSDAAGGYLVPTEESRQLIDLTSNWSVVPGLCQQVPMRTNVITFPTLTSGITAYWIPEATTVSASTQATGQKQDSTPTFGQMTITTHVLAILVYVSNQLLDDSDPMVDRILMDLFGRTLGSYFDLACLSGAGTTTDPVTGLDGKITTNSTSVGAVVDYDDVIDMIWSVYAQALGPGTQSLPIIMHPLGEKQFMKVKDEDGAYLYKRPTEGGRVPTLWGQPVYMDRNVSIALGGNSDQTKAYCGDFANHAYVGNSMNIVVKANPWMGDAFKTNYTAFLAEFRRGFQVDSEVFFSELTGIPTT